MLLLVAGLACALHRWVATDDFRLRMEQRAGAALGVPVRMAQVNVSVWPLPAVAFQDVTVQSVPPVTLERIEARPLWQPFLHGRLEVATLVVRKAVLPQRGIDAILLALQKRAPAASSLPGGATGGVQLAGNVASAESGEPAEAPGADLSWLPRRTVLQDVTWISTTGAQTALDGEIRLGADALPDSASLELIRGHHAGLRARLDRQPVDRAGQPAASVVAAVPGDQWALRIDVGGGDIEGKLGMQRVPVTKGRQPAGHELVLHGNFRTRGVEVTALTAPNRPLSGKLEADTTVASRASTTAGLREALQTHTAFTVRDATLNGIDLAKAVGTVGLSRGGQTRLETLAGQVTTQGRAIDLTHLAATSGLLSASGNVAVSPAKLLSGRISVQPATGGKLGTAIGSAAAVPLEVGGSLDDPQVSVSRAALLGAALGTLVMPGAGTSAGAKLGDRMGEKWKGLFAH